MEGMLRKKLKAIKWDLKKEMYSNVTQNVDIYRQMDVKASIVVVSYQYSRDLIRNLEKINDQKKNTDEIIFVNNGINDISDKINNLVDTKITLKENTGACIARNIGALFSNGEILIFVDDDGIPDENFIEGHLLTHKMYNVISVRGACIPKSNDIFVNHYALGEDVCTSYCDLEGNFSIRSDVFFAVGGWNDQLFYGHEGIELSQRILKYDADFTKQIYSPLPILYHDYTETPEEMSIKKRRQDESLNIIKQITPTFESTYMLWDQIVKLNVKPESMIPQNEKDSIFYDALLEKSKMKLLKWLPYEVNRLNIGHSSNRYDLKKNIEVYMRGKRIYIFGTGKMGNKVYNYLNDIGLIIEGFIDNNEKLHNQFLHNKRIIGTKEIPENAFIIIASSWSDDIKKQLEKMSYNYDEDFIISTI